MLYGQANASLKCPRQRYSREKKLSKSELFPCPTCPKGQLISGGITLHRICNPEYIVPPIVTIEPGSRGADRGQDVARQINRSHSLTWRLETLRESRTRSAKLSVSGHYYARADECRFQAESFRDPKARAQMLQLADSYNSRALLAEKFENKG